jgi:hypothetical protein
VASFTKGAKLSCICACEVGTCCADKGDVRNTKMRKRYRILDICAGAPDRATVTERNPYKDHGVRVKHHIYIWNMEDISDQNLQIDS